MAISRGRDRSHHRMVFPLVSALVIVVVSTALLVSLPSLTWPLSVGLGAVGWLLALALWWQRRGHFDGESLLRLITDSEPALISYIDPEFRYRWVNRAYESWFGRLPNTLFGERVREVIGEDSWGRTEPFLKRALAGERVTFENHALRDGRVRWGSVTYTPDCDDVGRVRGVVVLVQDITRRKHIEQELQQARAEAEATAQRLRVVFENMSEALLITDAAGNLSYHNPAALALHGYPDEKSAKIGITQLSRLWQLFDLGGRPLPFEQWPLSRILRGERFSDYEVLVHRKDTGLEFIGSYGGAPVFDGEGRLSLGIITVRDVTLAKRLAVELVEQSHELQRQNRELQCMNAELEEFAYVASHDLKAPLRAVANLALVIDEDVNEGLDQENRHRLHLLRERVKRMDALIDGLLAYARLGCSSGGSEPVQLAPLLRELVGEFSLPKGFRVQLSEPLPVVRGDPVQLRQIFQNLIGNAVAHHDRPDGQVRISAHDQGDVWLLKVADDGPGIPEGRRDEVFRMFATSATPGHTGIGLAVVRKLVQGNGGSVQVLGNVPRGALLCITWPKIEHTATQCRHQQQAVSSAQPEEGGGGAKRITPVPTQGARLQSPGDAR